MKGHAPRQIEDMDLDLAPAKGKKGAAVAATDDFDEDALFGAASFNDDDIDLEGFEISDGQPY